MQYVIKSLFASLVSAFKTTIILGANSEGLYKPKSLVYVSTERVENGELKTLPPTHSGEPSSLMLCLLVFTNLPPQLLFTL